MDRLPEAWGKYVEAAAIEFARVMGVDVAARYGNGKLVRGVYEEPVKSAILAFLNEAEKDGWVMVPMDADETMLEAGRKAWKAKRLHVSHAASDEFMTCGVIYRAMVGAV